MTFRPVLPYSGFSGWQFLQRTIGKQKIAFANSLPVKSDADYFRKNINKVRTADDLVADRRLLQVALGAFGLDDDLNSKFFIKKVLQDGTSSTTSLSAKLADKRYAAFAKEFGLGKGEQPRTGFASFGENVTSLYLRKQFERAVGEQNSDMRSALNLDSGLVTIMNSSTSDNARWFSIMGNPPVRAVFEVALGLPKSLARIDLDQQRETFKSRARSTFGTDKVGEIATAQQQEKLVRLFLIKSEAESVAATSSGNIALTLLQSAPRRF